MVKESLFPFLEVRPEGLYAPAFGAYLDPPIPVPRAILTHAHSDHAVPGHGEIWATPETARIYRRRHPEWPGGASEFSYGTGLETGAAALRFFSAGHVLGSAQLRFVMEDHSLLYTGDFKRRSSRTCAPAEAPSADILLTETTFGLPVFRFPGKDEIEARLLEACRQALDEGKTPVLLAYAFGKSQEVAAILTEAGIPTVLHGAAWKLLPEYEAAGLTFPISRAYETGPPSPGEALIAAPGCARTPMVQKIKRKLIVYCSGWAIREASRADHDADVLLPMSDHADFVELLQHVSEVAPRRVVTLHGYAEDFARILAARGMNALPLTAAAERTSEDA